ncbi:LysR family transcriptional regulator [Paraburkholderia tropica]|uniref:LysR family transcriptional regulator n=1 Tax=Paraburkholderia tropica TaxID=92647 RepID=UPI002AB72767|nr:LysR family transcriptional regulator [Paraburkholderia tropica]
MKLGHFDLNLLVALDALLDTRSVTRASERLHIGASATSSALGRLREYFGDDLLTQVGRRMELTPLGKALAKPVKEILLSVQSTVIARPDFDPADAKRDFTIRASDYLTTVLLVSVVQRLQREAPGIKLHIANMTDDVNQQLDRGEIDFVIYPSAGVSQRHASSVLFEDTYSCVVWADSDAVGAKLDVDLYQRLGHVAATFGDSRRMSFETLAIAEMGLQRSIEVTTNNFNTLPQLVVGTSRVATIHTRLAEIYAKYLPLRIFPVPFPLPPLIEVLQWHEINDNDPAHRWLRDLIKEQAAVQGASVRKRSPIDKIKT